MLALHPIQCFSKLLTCAPGWPPDARFSPKTVGVWTAGTYNDILNNNMSAPCQACPTGTTSAIEGATSKDDCKRELQL